MNFKPQRGFRTDTHLSFYCRIAYRFLLVGVLIIAALKRAESFAASPKGLVTENQLTLDRIFGSPSLDGPTLKEVHFSPSGDRLTFLKPKENDFEQLDLFEVDLKSGQEKLLVDSMSLPSAEMSEVEKAQRERRRITQKGIVSYQWAHQGEALLVPASGQIFIYQLKHKGWTQLTKDKAPSLNAQFSFKDRFVSFTRGSDLFVLDRKTQRERRILQSKNPDIFYGRAEFIAEEEMGRFRGTWWSEDDQFLAFTEVDESEVKLVDRVEIQSDEVLIRKQRYPEVGSPNAKVRLGIIRISQVDFESESGAEVEPIWVPLPPGRDIYLARVKWTPDQKLAYQIQSRDQKKLEVFEYNPETKKSSRVLTEKSRTWVNLHDDWAFFKDGKHWIWASERTGHKHLYLYDRRGRVIRQLTRGAWEVKEIEAVDEEQGTVYFTANKESPVQKDLYQLNMNRSQEPFRLTQGSGWNDINIELKAKRFVLGHSNPSQPLQWSLHDLRGQHLMWLEENKMDQSHPLTAYREEIAEPELASFKGPSGDQLYYWLFKPKNFDEKKQYPLVVHGYGGPGSQLVTQAWGGRRGYIAQVFNQLGFVVAIFDNRGSKGRGKKFEEAFYRRLGQVEVKDQVSGVQHLIQKGFIDPQRVGFWGWSYGGYLALMLAGQASETYKAVAAVAPVTDFRLYDTHYTERFLGNPQSEKRAFKRANVLNYTKFMNSELLVIHGMADDNVLFTNATLLFEKLQKDGKLYESVTYPGAKHGLSGKANQIHVYKTMVDFFQRRL